MASTSGDFVKGAAQLESISGLIAIHHRRPFLCAFAHFPDADKMIIISRDEIILLIYLKTYISPLSQNCYRLPLICLSRRFDTGSRKPFSPWRRQSLSPDVDA